MPALQLRQIALVAEHLEEQAAILAAVLDLPAPFRDPGVAEFGLRNVVFAVGTTFLEIVSPAREGTAAGRYRERQGGDAGYMVILQHEDLARARARLDETGVRVAWEIQLEDIATLHLHPRDTGGVLVSLDQPRPPAAWRWGGPGWEDKRRSGAATAVVGATLAGPDPEGLQRRWSQFLDLPPLADSDRSGLLALAGGRLRFLAGAGADRLAGVDLAAGPEAGLALERARAAGLEVAGDAFTFCGVRFSLLRAQEMPG
jgi:hypothetical protein